MVRIHLGFQHRQPSFGRHRSDYSALFESSCNILQEIQQYPQKVRTAARPGAVMYSSAAIFFPTSCRCSSSFHSPPITKQKGTAHTLCRYYSIFRDTDPSSRQLYWTSTASSDRSVRRSAMVDLPLFLLLASPPKRSRFEMVRFCIVDGLVSSLGVNDITCRNWIFPPEIPFSRCRYVPVHTVHVPGRYLVRTSFV